MSNLVIRMKRKAKKGGLMPANSAAGRIAAHLPIGKMGMPAAKVAAKQKNY